MELTPPEYNQNLRSTTPPDLMHLAPPSKSRTKEIALITFMLGTLAISLLVNYIQTLSSSHLSMQPNSAQESKGDSNSDADHVRIVTRPVEK